MSFSENVQNKDLRRKDFPVVCFIRGESVRFWFGFNVYAPESLCSHKIHMKQINKNQNYIKGSELKTIFFWPNGLSCYFI